MPLVFNEPTCMTCGRPVRLCRCKPKRRTVTAENADRDMLLETTIDWIENSVFARGVKTTPGANPLPPMLD